VLLAGATVTGIGRSSRPTEIRACLPASWSPELEGATIAAVDTGMSDARVLRLDAGLATERYLKIAEGKGRAQLRREIERITWLAARNMRVPRILRTHEGAGTVALLSEAVPGVVASEAEIPPRRLAVAIGRGLAQLHALAVAECPFDETALTRLARARALIRRGWIKAEEFVERNRELAPRALWARLSASVPVEELVVAHGDATLGNMIVDRDGTVGFVDCGHCGKADRYLDLAVTAQELEEAFGNAEVEAFARAYGERVWNRQKARFFSDLYELF
jgi:aminoglycoside 3'-phosphotransferase-2